MSPLDFRDYKERSRTIEDFAAAAEGNVANLRGNLTGEGEPERADVVTVTANFFPLLGVRPLLGRQFQPEEEVVNGPHVVMLSYRLWQRRYAADPSLVGKTIQIDGVAHEVVGILPRNFTLQLPKEAFQVTDGDLWAPIQFDYGQPLPRNLTFFTVFGRLAPKVTMEQAQAEMNLIAEQFRSEFKEHAASNLRIRAVPLHYDVVKHARPALLVLLGAVGMVLLIACANVANLLLVRGTTRQAEFALRTALGASRGAMIRQVLSESLLLALAGGGLGLGITLGALEVLRRLHPANLPRLADVRMDGTVLLFTVVICAVTSVLFGLVPALRAAATDPQEHLKSGGRGGSAGDRRRARSLLIVAEVALSVVLLVGAGLLIRSFIALQRVDPGYDGSDVLTFELSMPSGKYPGGAPRRAFFRELREKLAALPGVTTVGLVSQLPLTGSGPLSPFAYNEETARNFESVTADGRNVSPEYFEAMDAKLLAGRTFTYQDSIGTPPVIIVDETLAKLAWPGQNAVGKQLQLAPTGDAERVLRGRGRRGAHAAARSDARHPPPDLLPDRAGHADQHDVRGRDDPRSREPDSHRASHRERDGPRPSAEPSDADEHVSHRGPGSRALQSRADERAGSGGATAHRGGRVRGHFLLGQPAHPRVRHPAGAGRGSEAHPPQRGDGWDAAGVDQYCDRAGRVAPGDETDRRVCSIT